MSIQNSHPSINETAFDCPHCGAYTTQYWFHAYASRYDENSTPHFPDRESMKHITEDKEISSEVKNNILEWYERINLGLVFLSKLNDSKYVNYEAENLYFSKCYRCNKVAVWIHKSLLFPKEKIGIKPNQDLPDDIICDFNEARSIAADSPRGAAALLRLCIQKLCVHLGEKGKNLDTDIANIVAKGLNPLVQKSLDIVRVIGNESVHPGVIDFNDDKDVVDQLFILINSICDQMITHPKNVEKLYNKLPENKRKAIEKRDKQKNL
jgi:hypothetical protein